MHSLIRSIPSVQRVFAFTLAFVAISSVAPRAGARGSYSESPAGANGPVNEANSWEDDLRLWIELLRLLLPGNLPAADSSAEYLMQGTVNCYFSGGFPTFGPGQAPATYTQAVQSLHDLSLRAPSYIDPDTAAAFRDVMQAAGAKH